MNREIMVVLDTETTDLDHNQGRITDVGCITVVDGRYIGDSYQRFINPGDVKISPEVYKITGINNQDLIGYPKFEDIVDELFAFIGDKTIIAHNANFDISFLNAERARLGLSCLTNKVIDTIDLARKQFPGSSMSLDNLCDHLGIDRSHRMKHGALLDAKLTAKLYIALANNGKRSALFNSEFEICKNDLFNVQASVLLDDEIKSHELLISQIPNSLWNNYRK